MFEPLFHCPRVLARHHDGPSSQERELFLTHCASGGATRASLLHLASELLLVARLLNLSDSRLIDPQEIEVACNRWIRRQQGNGAFAIRSTAGNGLSRPLQAGFASLVA